MPLKNIQKLILHQTDLQNSSTSPSQEDILPFNYHWTFIVKSVSKAHPQIAISSTAGVLCAIKPDKLGFGKKMHEKNKHLVSYPNAISLDTRSLTRIFLPVSFLKP